MTIAEYLRSISFEDIEEILWEVYGMGDNFTPFIKMTYDRICHQTGTSEHSYMIVQIVNVLTLQALLQVLWKLL